MKPFSSTGATFNSDPTSERQFQSRKKATLRSTATTDKSSDGVLRLSPWQPRIRDDSHETYAALFSKTSWCRTSGRCNSQFSHSCSRLLCSEVFFSPFKMQRGFGTAYKLQTELWQSCLELFTGSASIVTYQISFEADTTELEVVQG